VISAMKMETVVAAPCAGVVTAVQRLSAGDTVAAGQVVAVIAPAEGQTNGRGPSSPHHVEETWAPVLEQIGALPARYRVAIAGAGAADAGVQGVERLTDDPVTEAERLTA